MNLAVLSRSSWTFLVAGLLLVALVTLVTTHSDTKQLPLGSYSSRPDGALAAHLWLARLGYNVSTHTESRIDISQLRQGKTTLLLMAKGSDISNVDIPSALHWVRSGGRMVLISDGNVGRSVLRVLGLRIGAASQNAVAVRQPLLLSPEVNRLSGHASFIVEGSQRDVQVATAGSSTVLLLRRFGAGEIWVLTSPVLLENDYIARAQNRQLVLNLAGVRGSKIYIKESDGAVASTASGNWILTTAWGAALLFLTTVVLLHRWLSGWRLGPALFPARASNRTLEEYVISLASILQRGKRRADILAEYQSQLRRSIAQRHGGFEEVNSGDPTNEEIHELLAPATRLSEGELLRKAVAIVAYQRRLGGPRD